MSPKSVKNSCYIPDTLRKINQGNLDRNDMFIPNISGYVSMVKIIVEIVLPWHKDSFAASIEVRNVQG